MLTGAGIGEEGVILSGYKMVTTGQCSHDLSSD